MPGREQAYRYQLQLSTISLFCFLVISLQSFSQQPRTELLYEIFSEEDGLPSSVVNCIAQDKFGFLWFGTEHGLSRYDGTTFETFLHTDDSLSIQSDEIGELFVTKDGKLWIGFNYGGVSVFNASTKSFKNYLPGDNINSLPDASVDMIFEDSKGTIWISVSGTGLFKFEHGNFRHIIDITDIDEGYEGVTKDFHNTIYGMAEFQRQIWVASHNGLYTFDGKDKLTPVNYEIKKPGRIRKDAFLQMLNDGRETLWLTSWGGGLSCYNTATGLWQNFQYNSNTESSSANVIWSAQWKTATELWVATSDKGLGVFNTLTKKFNFFSDPILADMNQLVFVDRNSQLWFPTVKVLLKLDSYKNQFSYHSTSFKYPRFFQFDSTNNELIISPNVFEGLYVENKANGKTKLFSPANSESGTIIKDILQTRDKTTWLLTYKKLYKYKKGQLTSVPAFSSSTDTYTALLEDRDGLLWVIKADNNTIIKYDIHTNELVHLKNLSLGTYPHSIVQNINGDVWTASFKGIALHDAAKGTFNHFSNVNENKKIPDNRISDATCDNSGKVWFSTLDAGIFEVHVANDSLVYASVDQGDGLASNNIISLAADDNDCLWITSRGCITKFNTITKSIDNFYLPKELESQFKISKLQEDGRLYIGGDNGYYSFDPRIIQIERKAPRVYIKALKFAARTDFVMRDSVYIDNIQREGEDNNLEIEFGAITSIDSKRIKFAYQLCEVDTGWIFPTNKNFASYPSIPVNDSLTFQVRACNEFGVWSEPVVMRIFVKPTLMERTDAKISVGLGVLGLLTFLFWFQARRIKMKALQESLINNRIAESKLTALRSQINPHFIFNALNAVQNTILIQQYDNAIRYLGDFSLLLRKILDNSFYSFVSLRDEIQTLELYLKTESIRFDNTFEWQVTVDESIRTDKVEIPSMLLQPFLENSVQHGLLPKQGESEKVLNLSFFKNGDRLICEIKDNGVGRSVQQKLKLDQKATHESRGIKLIEDRISLLNERYKLGCKLMIEDLIDEAGRPVGTKVDISFNFNVLHDNS